MVPKMEMLFSAAFGELVTRCISFLIKKYSATTAQSRQELLKELERALLRVAVTVEEAAGRSITNQAMLRQLIMMREDMYRGYYMLDKFRYLGYHEDEEDNDQAESRSLAPSITIPGKLTLLSASNLPRKKDLEQMLDGIQSITSGMGELVAFLKNYPPMFRQPYSMHLLLEKCMFFRPKEMEQTIQFLLQREPSSGYNLGVLPIIGRGKVGKSTLVEHVCCNERVRDHFSKIVIFNGNTIIEDEELHTLNDGGILKYNKISQDEGKMLLVIELDGDVDEGAWTRLLSASQSRLPYGSKILITSRSEKIKELGTTQALRLDFLPREACWYFFKVLAFGTAYPEDQPKLASIALEIFEEYYSNNDTFSNFSGSFANSINIAGLLRADVSTQHWRRILAGVKETVRNNQVPFSVVTADARVEKRQFFISRISSASQYFLVDEHHRVAFAHEEVPKINIDQVMCGSVTPQGKFEAVWWRSHLPPYYSYVASCEIRDSKCLHERKRCCISRKRKSLG